MWCDASRRKTARGSIRRSLSRAAILLPALLLTTGASEPDERARLYNLCSGVRLLVGPVGSEAKKLGLTEGRIQDAAESRLRTARLLKPEAIDVLYIGVQVMSRAYLTRVEFHKLLLDPHTLPGTVLAPTWSGGDMGVNETAPGVVASLSAYLDKFIADYLRINERACDAVRR